MSRGVLESEKAERSRPRRSRILRIRQVRRERILRDCVPLTRVSMACLQAQYRRFLGQRSPSLVRLSRQRCIKSKRPPSVFSQSKSRWKKSRQNYRAASATYEIESFLKLEIESLL